MDQKMQMTYDELQLSSSLLRSE